MPLVKSKILMILPSCHLSSIPGKFLCMLVQNGCLDSQQVHVFAHVKKSVFAKKNQKWCNFWAPKTGAHFWTYNLQLQSNFLLKWYGAPKMGPKNGTQKWCPKKWKKCWQKHPEIIAGKLLHWHAIATLDCISSSVIGARTKWWHEMHSEILATS